MTDLVKAPPDVGLGAQVLTIVDDVKRGRHLVRHCATCGEPPDAHGHKLAGVVVADALGAVPVETGGHCNWHQPVGPMWGDSTDGLDGEDLFGLIGFSAAGATEIVHADDMPRATIVRDSDGLCTVWIDRDAFGEADLAADDPPLFRLMIDARAVDTVGLVVDGGIKNLPLPATLRVGQPMQYAGHAGFAEDVERLRVALGLPTGAELADILEAATHAARIARGAVR